MNLKPESVKVYDGRIIHIKYSSLYVLASSFMRLQEYYESDIPSIYRKVFSLEHFMDEYSQRMGNFTYTTDWGGFNVPGGIVKEFHAKYKGLLLEKEVTLFDTLKENTPNFGKFYVIGTSSEGEGVDASILNHEIAHALWYTNESYFKEMSLAIDNLDSEVYYELEEALMRKGYHRDVLTDEIHAYLSTGSEGLIGQLPLKDLHRFIGIFNKYSEGPIKALI